MLLLSRQGKVRLSKWYTTYPQKERAKITRAITPLVLGRALKLCNFLDYQDIKVKSKAPCCPLAGHTHAVAIMLADAELAQPSKDIAASQYFSSLLPVTFHMFPERCWCIWSTEHVSLHCAFLMVQLLVWSVYKGRSKPVTCDDRLSAQQISTGDTGGVQEICEPVLCDGH